MLLPHIVHQRKVSQRRHRDGSQGQRQLPSCYRSRFFPVDRKYYEEEESALGSPGRVLKELQVAFEELVALGRELRSGGAFEHGFLFGLKQRHEVHN